MERRIGQNIPTEICGPPPEVIPNIPGRSEETETNLWHNGKHPRLSGSEGEAKNQPIARLGVSSVYLFFRKQLSVILDWCLRKDHMINMRSSYLKNSNFKMSSLHTKTQSRPRFQFRKAPFS